jgi:hypothetical protein
MLKSDVRSFWDQGSAGEFWAVGSDAKSRFVAEEKSRYQFEPFMPGFADFPAAADQVVLEIGVDMGGDHQQWAPAGPRHLLGTDLSWRSIAYARERLDLFNLKSGLILAAQWTGHYRRVARSRRAVQERAAVDPDAHASALSMLVPKISCSQIFSRSTER